MPFAIRKERPHSDLNRLTSASGPFGTLSYSYDQVGNRLSAVVNGTGTTYSYGSYNKLMSAGTTSYSYDNNGNTITKTVGSNSWGYTYDYENRLKQVNLNGQTVLQALYDGDGRRIRTVAGDTTVYDYSGGSWDPAYVKDLTTGITTDIVFAGVLRIGEVQASGTSYDHLDFQRSIRLVTRSGSLQIFSTKYLPYGEPYSTSGYESFQYTGKQLDMSTTLFYYGNRYYDDQTGRFTSLDKHVPMMASPQTLNRYTYVVDNPNSKIDPDGKKDTSWEMGGISAPPSGQENNFNDPTNPIGGGCPCSSAIQGGHLTTSFQDSVLSSSFNPPGSLSGTYSPNPKRYGGHLVAELFEPNPGKGRKPGFNKGIMAEVDTEFAGASEYGFGPAPTTVHGGHLLMEMELQEEA